MPNRKIIYGPKVLVLVLVLLSARSFAQQRGTSLNDERSKAASERPLEPSFPMVPVEEDSVQTSEFMQSGENGLSLEHAMQMAEERSPDLTAARYRLLASEADTIGARLYPNPQLSINATNYGLLQRPIDATAATTSYRLDQQILLGGKISDRIATARESTAAARADYVRQVFSVREDVKDAYIDATYAEKQITLARENYDLFAELVRASELRLKAGDVAEQDVSKLKLTELTYRSALSDAQQSLLDALAKLRQTLFLDRSANLHTSYDFTTNGPVLDRDSLLSAAYENRSDFWASEHRVRAAENQVHLSHANAVPDLDVGVELDRQGPDFPNTVGGGIGIAIPIFSRNQDDIMRSEANYRASEYDLESTRSEIRNEVSSSYAKYQNSRRVMSGLDSSVVQIAEDVRNTAAKNYSAGHIGLLDLLQSEQVYNDAITNYYSALYKLAKNKIALERAVGKEIF